MPRQSPDVNVFVVNNIALESQLSASMKQLSATENAASSAVTPAPAPQQHHQYAHHRPKVPTRKCERHSLPFHLFYNQFQIIVLVLLYILVNKTPGH